MTSTPRRMKPAGADGPEGLCRPGRPPDRHARVGAVGILAAIAVFALCVVVALGVTGTAYVWQVNMISDLGDSACRIRDDRWICSPGFAHFNAGMIVAGVLLAASGGCLGRLWGWLLAGGLIVMGAGLVVAGAFPAGDDERVHLAGVVLALVVPGLLLLLSGIRPQTAWLDSRRVPRGTLGAVALVFCAESRLPQQLLPRGAGELIIVGCLLLALFVEASCILASRRR